MAVPEVGPDEVLVLVMGAGVNFNGVWAARGKPVASSRCTSEPIHIAGSDASGIVWKVGEQVKRWKVGDEVVVHCNQSCGAVPRVQRPRPDGLQRAEDLGLRDQLGQLRAVFQGAGAAALAQAEAARSGSMPPPMDSPISPPTGCSWTRRRCTAGDNVLVWGAAGGLGVFALQICRCWERTRSPSSAARTRSSW